MLQIPLVSLALFLIAMTTSGLAIYALWNLKVRGALEFSLLMISITFYIAGFGMEVLTPSVNGILFWLKVEYIGISTIPAFCLWLAIRLAGKDIWLKKWPIRVVLFIPVITLALYFTNSLHQLFYKGTGEVRQILYCYELEITKGPWYYVNIVFLNLALLASIILFIRKLKVGNVERQQARILIIGCLGPWIAHLIYQAGLSQGLDVGPFGFMVTAPLFAWGVFKNQMLFLLPMARTSVYQSFSDAVLILDHQKNLIDFNKTAGSLFKKIKSSHLGKPAADVFIDFPEMLGLIEDPDNQRIQGRLIIDQVRRSFILTKSFVYSKHEQRIGMIIVLHEITDQVFLLDNLRESEERYRLIFDHTPVGVLQFDTSGRITTCNDAFVKIIGSSREVLIGLNMLNLPDPAMVKVISESLAGSIGYYEHEYRSVSADKVTPVRGFFAPISTKDGQIHGGVGIVEDFTERFLSDQKLKYREEFESILITLELDFLNTEIGDMDKTFHKGLMSIGSYCEVDRAYLFHMDDTEQLMKRTHEWSSHGIYPDTENIQAIPVGSWSRWMESLNRQGILYIPDLTEMTEDWKVETAMLDRQGIKSLIAVSMEVGGDLLGFVAFASLKDLRTWNKDEIALLQVAGQIFASVLKRKEANEQLVEAKEKAEEASRVKSIFLANMSHEIRTPLNGILGFAELIQAETEEPVIKRYSDIILSSGNRLLQTLSQILDLSRVESGQIDLFLEPIRVNDAIDEIILQYSAIAGKKGLFIERQLGGPRLVLNLDRQLFRNSMSNLVSNAIKFTNHGGITISTSIDSINGKRYGSIRISDTGIGIPEQHFDSIFEDFRQVSEGVKREFEGTGLGLSLTKKFIQISGGNIRVESLHGHGSTFIMSFRDPVIV